MVEEVPKLLVAQYQKDVSVDGSFFTCCLFRSHPSGPPLLDITEQDAGLDEYCFEAV